MDDKTLARFWKKVQIDAPSECWVWTGAMSGEDRNRPAFTVGDTQVRAYRESYEHYIGPIPEGLTLDHVKERCAHRPICVNPWHCEPVPIRENVLRSDGPAAINARKTECKRGHPFVEGSYYVGKTGNRQCKQCTADSAAARKAANPEKYLAACAAATRRHYARTKKAKPT